MPPTVITSLESRDTLATPGYPPSQIWRGSKATSKRFVTFSELLAANLFFFTFLNNDKDNVQGRENFLLFFGVRFYVFLGNSFLDVAVDV